MYTSFNNAVKAFLHEPTNTPVTVTTVKTGSFSRIEIFTGTKRFAIWHPNGAQAAFLTFGRLIDPHFPLTPCAALTCETLGFKAWEVIEEFYTNKTVAENKWAQLEAQVRALTNTLVS